MKLSYLKRIFLAYVLRKKSQLSFWHDVPEINEAAFNNASENNEYFMKFSMKADYAGHLDKDGIPMLDYHGNIGLKYNPIAISQYGLGNINKYLRDRDQTRLDKAIAAAGWFLNNIETNGNGIGVWYHKFDFEYARLLKNPWYSGLAQGQILSFMVRIYNITKNEKYLKCAHKILASFKEDIYNGGVVYEDSKKNLWIEEYITFPPMHILNGFIWALWGIYDYMLLTGSPVAKEIYERSIDTLINNLERYDCGFWSLYDLSDKIMKNLASPFYHKLHIVQLNIMYRLTGNEIFQQYSKRWEHYLNNKLYRWLAFFKKTIFKVAYF